MNPHLSVYPSPTDRCINPSTCLSNHPHMCIHTPCLSIHPPPPICSSICLLSIHPSPHLTVFQSPICLFINLSLSVIYLFYLSLHQCSICLFIIPRLSISTLFVYPFPHLSLRQFSICQLIPYMSQSVLHLSINSFHLSLHQSFIYLSPVDQSSISVH